MYLNVCFACPCDTILMFFPEWSDGDSSMNFISIDFALFRKCITDSFLMNPSQFACKNGNCLYDMLLLQMLMIKKDKKNSEY